MEVACAGDRVAGSSPVLSAREICQGRVIPAPVRRDVLKRTVKVGGVFTPQSRLESGCLIEQSSSAVGSVRRSGRRGREFESPLLYISWGCGEIGRRAVFRRLCFMA